MLYEASLTGFIKAVLIILAAYYLLRWLTPYFLYFAVKKAEKKFAKQFEQFSQEHNNQEDQPSFKTAGASKKSNDSVGEYIDFEEID